MRKAFIVMLLSIFVSATACAAQKKHGEQKATRSGWRQLFNGRDLQGWQHVGPGGFVVEDGLLRTEGGMGLLWYTGEKFANCTIRLVYKTTSEASNAGLFVRIPDKPADPWFAVHKGYEVQICDKQDEYHRTGAIYSLAKSTTLASKPTGEWNTMEITLRGPRILVKVNDVLVNDFDPKQPVPERTKEFEPERGPRPEVGYIGLQNHDDYNPGSHVYFKEVSVRPL